MKAVTDCDRSAILSECGKYRYALARSWGNGPGALWIMLNPSTADAEQDDPTIRRCIDFTNRWGLPGLSVVNLFALRSTNPAALRTTFDPVGPHNDTVIAQEAEYAKVVVCAWGNRGSLYRRSDRVLAMLRKAGVQPQCLRLTKAGHPEHPLYLPKSLELIPLEESK